MEKLNILITGGAGFIGSHLTEKLLALNHNVTVIDNLSNGTEANLIKAKEYECFKFIKGDITKREDCNKATKQIDVVYHLACLGVRHSLHSPIENHKANTEGTLYILESSLTNKVKRFFYISSSEVYGDIRTFPINEEGIPTPKTIYGSSKLAGENYTYSYFKCFGLDTTILRIFNNYGPRAHYEGDAGEIIPRSIVNALYGKSPILFGDGSITRDFFFVKDTAEVLSKLLEIKNITGQIINIGTGEEISMKQLLEQIIELVNPDLKIEYHEDRPADVPRLWVDPKKFNQIINFNSTYTFKSGLIETISYYKELMGKNNLSNRITPFNWKK